MNKKDIKIIDVMIKEAWDDSNYFCRKLKDYLGKHFSHVTEIKERCKDPYWKKVEENKSES